MKLKLKLDSFTGGLLETNAYLLNAPEGAILFDAPEGAAKWVDQMLGQGARKLAHVLLTHGHYDHTLDAAKLKRKHGCRVWIHADSAPLLEHPESMAAFSPYPVMEGVKDHQAVPETEAFEISGLTFRTLLCPGHCPGSICFYLPEEAWCVGGDVLFSGGVGRWDLPGGSFEDLQRSIRRKLYSLPDATKVFPGHGPATTIGAEKRSNPFIPE
ncbi:MAG: MBL fold metallo-hydrolase [Verrucomicrobiae bacterium]|nr:MBL fold metallo-hydrolase [Verrucomicrobiae bacterium]